MAQSADTAQLFKKSNLAGKKVWYFTAPASVPITTIKQISLRDIKKGNTTCSYDGVDYGFLEDSVSDITKDRVLVPTSSDDSYRPC